MAKIDKNKPKAFVLGTTPNALGIIRSLGRKSVPVIAIGSQMDSAMVSRYCRSMIAQNVEAEEKKFLDFLLNIGKNLDQPGILFPTGDAYVHFVSENREYLKKYFKFALPERDTMRKLLNKKSQYQLAEKVGIPLPKTFYPEGFEDLKEISKKISYPAIIKPFHSVVWRKSYNIKKVIYAKFPEELIEGYKEIKQLNIEVMVQEAILGPDYTHYKICTYMDENSEPILIFTLKKIRNFPYHFGVGSVVQSLWLSKVADLGLAFLKKVKYIGIGSIEFKKDERDNKLKMIELNSRLWLQNSLADKCGMNFPYTLYRHLTGEEIEKQSVFKEGIKWVSMQMDYASFRQYHKDGE